MRDLGRLPKAHLHVHLESTIRWKTLQEIGDHRGVQVPESESLIHEWKLDYLRRDDEAYIPQPDSVRCVVATAMYGTTDEVRPGTIGTPPRCTVGYRPARWCR